MKFLIFLAAIVAACSAQNVVPGQCGKVELVQNFDVAAYDGVWNQIYRYENEFEPNADCVTAVYTLTDSGVVEVVNSMVVNNYKIDIAGTVSFAENANGTAMLVVQFPAADNVFNDYWVLSTDYTNYSLVYACWNLPNNMKRLSSWILSREKTLKPESVLAMDAARVAAGLNWDTFLNTNQTESACRTLN